MRKRTILSIAVLVIITITFSCGKEIIAPKYLTENVIVIVIDGARYSETWGDPKHENTPQLANYLSKSGIVNTQFYNNGVTKTVPGHSSITTGNYEEIDNTGKQSPSSPSFFQYWNAKNLNKSNGSWIIASKDKLEVLDNCTLGELKDLYKPRTNCGIDGLGTGYRHDSITFKVALDILQEYQPNLVLINFREPDYSGHSGNWNKYIKGIKSSDEYAYQIWNYIQQSPNYNGNTSLFITNDHGRHLDTVSSGFISHGDDCLGCRRLNFFAFGPDFKQDTIIDKKRELIDISATISELLQLEMKSSQGKVMFELFK